MTLQTVGRFSSRSHAESCRAEWEATMGYRLKVIEREAHAGEFTLTRVESTASTAAAPVQDQRDRFNVIPSAAFVKGTRPDYVIKGALYRVELAAIVAPPGAGKSAFAYSMAAAITRGVEWFGRRVRRGRAIYVCLEGVPDFRSRVLAYAQEHGAEHSDLPELITDVPDLKTVEDAALIAKKIGRADVVFVDTFAMSFSGNESSSEDVGPVLRHCKFIHEKTGALVVLICHPGKNESLGIRGWSGIKGALDTEIEIARNGDHRAVSIVKQKGGPEGPLMGFTLKVVEIGRDEDGDPVTGIVIEECEAPAKLSKKHPQFAGVNQNAIRRALEKLAPGGGRAKVSAVLTEALKYAPHDIEDGRAVKEKKQNLKKALDDLVAKPLVYLDGPDFVSLSPIQPVSAEDWLVLDIGAEAALQAATRGS